MGIYSNNHGDSAFPFGCHPLGPLQEPVDEATIASHKLVLWTPPADDPEHRKARKTAAVPARLEKFGAYSG